MKFNWKKANQTFKITTFGLTITAFFLGLIIGWAKFMVYFDEIVGGPASIVMASAGCISMVSMLTELVKQYKSGHGTHGLALTGQALSGLVLGGLIGLGIVLLQTWPVWTFTGAGITLLVVFYVLSGLGK